MGGWRRVCAEASLFLAVASIACSVIFVRSYELRGWAFLVAVVLAPMAIVCGSFGHKLPADRVGSGLCATLGLALGVVALVLPCGLLGAAPGGGKAYRVELASNMRQIGLALLQYETDNGRLPPAVVRDSQGRPLSPL